MFHEEGSEVCNIAGDRFVVLKGSVLWSEPCIEITQDCQEVVCWDISDDCCKVLKELPHFLRWSHVGGRMAVFTGLPEISAIRILLACW